MDLVTLIAENADAGVISRARLIALGAEPREISKLRHAGVLLVIRRGWYAVAGADTAVITAVRAGGTVTCVSALAFHPEVWVPPGVQRTHIRWPVHRAELRGSGKVAQQRTARAAMAARRQRDRGRNPRRADTDDIGCADGARRARRTRDGPWSKMRAWSKSSPGSTALSARCHSHRPLSTSDRAVDPRPIALQCAANCLSPDYVVAVLDSTLRRQPAYTLEDLRVIFAGAPHRVLRLLDRLDAEAGSGSESVARFRLQNARFAVRSQVEIEDVGHVDLLVGERLIVQCDSKAHHNDEQRREDNRRDRRATVSGYSVLRIEYVDVMFSWNTVLADVVAIIRGRPRVPGRH
ncbi:type IV toxin-antitoxin system AbiEi family antitoxin domain-containing protein [Tsukamurella pseudospumae]|uniref:DUF559 domain-containing protein n=1 Tax=Tsukamurella pseudospumae TaxID=239498 RepID=A0A137ZJ71_9ACTN|nr:type IV toxin-antitoxin system AbiEi family antitoxin domain-containing protein [Tsukamurella pseudospumae]KXO98218.1 hypothetical protein AXK61_19500 [Tsukamurella pseudospumae]